MELTEIKKILKGKWEFNILNDVLICKNKNMTYFFENSDNTFFQGVISLLSEKGVPNPELKLLPPSEDEGEVIPFELFNRILRANLTIYEPKCSICETDEGLLILSNHINYLIQTERGYSITNCVTIDPHTLYTVTRSFRDRERVIMKLKVIDNKLIIKLDFPWIVLTVVTNGLEER